MTEWPGRSKVIRILATIIVLAVVLAGVGLSLPRFFSSGDGDAVERKLVTSRATDFAVAYNTYDVADVADYQRRLKSLLTSEYNEQFVGVTNAVFEALTDKKQQSGEAKILAVAIDSIDEDSAEALVAVDASITNTDNAAAVVRSFRWKVFFLKDNGKWLVSNFESVAAVTAETAAPSATATPQPTASGDEK